MTYFELFNILKSINKEHYHDEILYEYIYDDLVYDKLSFLSNRNILKPDAQQVIEKFEYTINNNIP